MCVFPKRLIEYITSDAIDPDSEVVDCSIDAFFLSPPIDILVHEPYGKIGICVVKLVRLIEKIDSERLIEWITPGVVDCSADAAITCSFHRSIYWRMILLVNW